MYTSRPWLGLFVAFNGSRSAASAPDVVTGLLDEVLPEPPERSRTLDLSENGSGVGDGLDGLLIDGSLEECLAEESGVEVWAFDSMDRDPLEETKR